MACGWHRGYFGMQVNSETERRIIFSVWDSGNEAVSREKVGEADRVALVAKSPGVSSGDFGNEGTGGHSHLVYSWKTGERQRFAVTAQPVDATHTVYAAIGFNRRRRNGCSSRVGVRRRMAAGCAGFTASAKTSAARTGTFSERHYTEINGFARRTGNGRK
jgi:hypothetical protein